MIASGNIEFDERGPSVSEADVAEFERKYDVVFPQDYRAFLLTINGGRPIPSGFRLNKEGSLLDWRVHYFFGLKEPVDACNLDWVNTVLGAKRPKDTIAIASDEAGNYLYIRAAGQDWSPVYFGPTPYDGKSVSLHLLAESFSEFLDNLHVV